MSWAKDEWKQDLPAKVLQNITSLENELQSLHKLKFQHEMKFDGLMASLEKEKTNVQETKLLNSALQNEIQEIMAKKSNLETKQEKYVSEIKSKDISLAHTEEILEKVRQKLKVETAKSVELQRSMDTKRAEAEGYAERSEMLSMEVAKLKQEKLSLVKENEGLHETLTVLEKEKNIKKAPHQEKSEDKQTTVEENEPCVATAKTCSSSDVMLDMLKKENTALVRDLDDLKQQCEQLRHLVEEKEKEVERGRSKITNMTVEMQAATLSLKEKEQKVQRLEVSLENSRLDTLRLQKELEKYKENERNKDQKKYLENVGKIQVQEPEDDKQENNDETTLEELMTLLVEHLKTNQEMRNDDTELPCHVVQNLNQVIVVTQEHEKRQEKNDDVTQSTQTMCITEFDEQSNYIPNDEQETTNVVEDDEKVDLQKEDEFRNNNHSLDPANNDLPIDKKFSQISDILVGVQREHEVILASAEECVCIVATIKEALERPQLSFMALLFRLSHQLEVIMTGSERCKQCLESLDKDAEELTEDSDKEGVSPRGSSSGSYKDIMIGSERCKQCLESLDKTFLVDKLTEDSDQEGVSPRGSSSGSYKDSGSESKRDLSWDNFESDQAFQKFKNNMDVVLTELERQKGGQTSSSKCKGKAVKDSKCKMSCTQQGQEEIKSETSSITRGENYLEIEQVVEILEKLVDDSNARWFQKTEGLFEHFEQTLQTTIQDQMKTKPEPSVQKLQDYRPNEDGSVGENAFQELEYLKLKIDDVQKIVKHFLASVEVAETEKEKAYSHIDLLSNHVHTMESDHEIHYKELEENIKSASDREISLERKCSSLQQEKDEVDDEMKDTMKHLQKKELELLKVMQKIKKMQSECEQTETKLKNENKTLRKQNCSIWKDYEKAASELEDKNKELKSLMGSMKTTEHSLLSLFNTIGNIDDFLQRAKEMNLFH